MMEFGRASLYETCLIHSRRAIGGGLLKIGVVSELHLGPQVGDEHTGDPQGTSLAS